MFAKKDILQELTSDEWVMSVVRTVASINLPDWWIGAGFVRNKVWDVLHGYKERTPLNDIDVIYFDADDVSETSEKNIEKKLKKLHPALPWSVKNQTRMALIRGDGPYKDAEDGLSRWVETATCVGVRLNDENKLELAAPLGIEDLVKLVLRSNKRSGASLGVFQKRIEEKRWLEKWPKLKIAKSKFRADD